MTEFKVNFTFQPPSTSGEPIFSLLPHHFSLHVFHLQHASSSFISTFIRDSWTRKKSSANSSQPHKIATDMEKLFRCPTYFSSSSLSHFFSAAISTFNSNNSPVKPFPANLPHIYPASSTFRKSDPASFPSFPSASNSPQPQQFIHQHILTCRFLDTNEDHHQLYFSHTKWQQTCNHLQILYLSSIKVHIFLSRPNFQLPLSTFCRSKYAGHFPR